MQTVLQIIGLAALVIGTLFSILGILGMLRLPDVYTRLHSTGKVSVFGAVLMLVAAISLTPLSLGKGLVLIFLILLAAPAVSHAIASSAYRSGIPMKVGQRDELKNASCVSSQQQYDDEQPPQSVGLNSQAGKHSDAAHSNQ